jgi:hypothetical protein
MSGVAEPKGVVRSTVGSVLATPGLAVESVSPKGWRSALLPLRSSTTLRSRNRMILEND